MSRHHFRKPRRFLRKLFAGFHLLPSSKRGRKKTALLLFSLITGLTLAYLPEMGLGTQKRVDKWSEEAIVAYTDGEFEEASSLVTAARKLDPENRLLVLMEARIALRLNQPDILDLWKPLIASAEVTADDLSELAWYLSETGMDDEVNRLLPIILERNAEGAKARELYLESLVRGYQYSQAEKIAKKWIAEGAKDWFVHKALADVLLRDPRKEKNDEGLSHLRKLSVQNDENGIEAIRYLISVAEDPTQKAALMEKLEAHPRLAVRDRFYLATWKYLETHSISFRDAAREVREIINPSRSEGQKQYLRWLAGVNAYDEILIELPRTEALADQTLNELYFEALLAERQPEEIIDATRELQIKTLALDEVSAQLYRARAFAALGQTVERDKALDWAMTLAKDEQVRLVEFTLRRMQLTDTLEVYFWRLLSQKDYASYAAPRILQLNYDQADEISLAKALELIDFETIGDHPGSRLFLAYLNLLYRPTRSLESIQVIEDIIASHPGLVESQLMLAFSYYLHGQARNVERFLGTLPQSAPTSDFRYLQIAFFVLHADELGNGEIDLSGFLPRERALVTAASSS